MNAFLQKISESFEIGGKGSGRKMSAFAVMLFVSAAHIAWLKKAFMENDFVLLPQVLIIDFTFILALFGLTTWQGISPKPNAEPPTKE